MNSDDTTYELIDQYLQGELPEDHPFIQRLKNDSDLALEVEVRRLLPDAVVDYRLMEVEKLIASRKSKFIKQNSGNWKWALLSLPVILIGTATYFYLSPENQSTAIQKAEKPAKEAITLPPKVTEVTGPVNEIKAVTKQSIAKTSEKPKEEPQNSIIAIPEVSPKTLTETTAPVAVSPERKEEPAPQTEAIPVALHPCNGIRLKAYVEENRPCSGNSEGSLTIKEARGGKAPYQFAINRNHFQEENKFAGLKEAEYDVIIKDANGCETIVYGKYHLKSKSCIHFSEHIFNPHAGTWEVPNNQENGGDISVLDANGNRVYLRSFEKGEKLNWGGTSENGAMLAPGMYIYSIKYTDGVVDQGRITITY